MNFTEPGPGNIDKKTADLEKADLLFFFSFRLSQGSVDLQDNIFRWLRINYPDIAVDFKALRPLAMKRAMDVVIQGRGVRHGAVDLDTEEETANFSSREIEAKFRANITATVDEQLDSFREVLEGEEDSYKKELIPEMLEYFISKDYEFLVEKGGRPTTQHKFFSYVCSNILLGLPSGRKEYDQMLKQIKEYLIHVIAQGETDPNDRTRLREIIAVHNAHYPDKQVNLENL